MPSVEVVADTFGERERAVRAAGIAGLGSALPPALVGTAQIAGRVGVDPQWIVRRTGIESRRWLAPEATVAELAASAGRSALADADVAPGELDAVLVATATADHVMPAAAPLVAHALGAQDAMAWDVGLACTGFLATLVQGAGLIESGRAERVLVIAAEALSRVTDHADHKTAALFGDGAGAVLLEPAGRLRLRSSVLRADAQDAETLMVGHRERLVRMDGPLVFRRAVAAMEARCLEVLDESGLGIDDVDLVVPHQANARITLALRERLGLPADRVADTIAHHGNTGAASIPLALAEVPRPLPDRILLTAFGAGFASGAMLVEAA
jgi:3-oxoacyl-[acyl-carrier-protein] synthase III